MAKLFKKDGRTFNVEEKNVLKVLDIINDCTMDELYNLSITRLNDSMYAMHFFVDDAIWDDVINELHNKGYELILKPNHVTYLRERR